MTRMRFGLLSAVLAAWVAGCGAGPPKQAGETDDFDVEWDDSSGPKSSSSDDDEEVDEDGLDDDQKAQMDVALRRGKEKAENCPQVVEDSPTGEGDVIVVFDGAESRVTDVDVMSPFADTPVEPCIKRAYIGEIILPFDGEPRRVTQTIKLEKK